MSDANDPKSEQKTGKKQRSENFENARSAFENLDIEEKAFFIVESMFDAMADGLEKAGKAARDAVQDAVDEMERQRCRYEGDHSDADASSDHDDNSEASSQSKEPQA